MQKRTKIGIAVTLLGLAGVAVAVAKPDMLALSSSPQAGTQAVLATVNRQAITAADVEPLMATGMAKAVAVENAVNRTLTAEAALRLWPADAQAISNSVTREALSGLFVRKRFAEIQKAVSDADIARYYETNITDEMYSGHVLKYYLTQDAKDAADIAEAAKQGGGAVLAKFSWVNKDNDHAVQPGGVPYGLYQQVKGMQPNQIAGPFRVREGLLFLRLEERKTAKRPDLPKVTDEIRGILAQQRLEVALKELREQAKIELK
ncbi:MAG: peptidylprolyl isomerase [Pseudomonadota bacterium]